MFVFNNNNLRLKILTFTLFIMALFYWKISFAPGVVQESPQDITDEQVIEVYHKLIVVTGQTQNALPFKIQNSPVVNAFNDGQMIVMFRGIIDDTKNLDEIALILGHEIAHGMLQHLGKLNSEDPREIAVLEANADKYGAILMMRAGYDVCKARDLFKRWSHAWGNSLNGDHPANSYRWAELNVNCGEM